MNQHALLLAWLLTSLTALSDTLQKYKDSAAKWEKDIQKLEQQDRAQPDPKDALLFVGSSSIRTWSDIKKNMAPYPVIQRGYGGAKFSDLAWYAKRLIYPHRFKALLLFVGNDVSGSKDDKTPEEVADLFRYVLKVVREKYPDTPVFLIEITPTIKRWAAWPKIREVNQMLKAVCEREPHTYFIQTASHFLDNNGQPKESLFRDDKLHLNQNGYAVWSKIIKNELGATLP